MKNVMVEVVVVVVAEREEGFDVSELKDVLVGRRRLGACGRQIVVFPVPPLSIGNVWFSFHETKRTNWKKRRENVEVESRRRGVSGWWCVMCVVSSKICNLLNLIE